MPRQPYRRKIHAERAQPRKRRRLGLLEKHKDYVLRARAFHEKKDRLMKLKRAAESRNPDEFNFKMIKAHTKGGVWDAREEAKHYTPEEIMLMQTQDLAYLQMRNSIDLRKAERLRGLLHHIDDSKASTHLRFEAEPNQQSEVSSAVVGISGISPSQKRYQLRQKQRKSQNLAELPHLDDQNPFSPPAFQRPASVSPEESEIATGLANDSYSSRKINDKIQRSYEELTSRENRAEKLKNMIHRMELRKALTGGRDAGNVRKLLPNAGPPVYVWKSQRKR